MNATYNQTGDLLYFPLGFPYLEKPTSDEIPKEAKQAKGTQVFAASGGNSHGFKGSAGVFQHGEALFIDAQEDVTLTHPEHEEQTLFAGKFEVRHVREKDHFNDLIRAVVD